VGISVGQRMQVCKMLIDVLNLQQVGKQWDLSLLAVCMKYPTDKLCFKDGGTEIW
jgi:hypothetical protein